MRTYFLLPFLVLFSACAHHPQIANFGFYSYDPQDRDVYCVGSEADPVGQGCARLTTEALAHLNPVVHGHYRYKGELSNEDAVAKSKAGEHFVGLQFVGALKGNNKLGVTFPDFDAHRLLQGARIALNPDLFDKHEKYALGVVMHELVHALGAMHGDSDAPLQTLMTPSVTDDAASDKPSAGDVEVLKAAYPSK